MLSLYISPLKFDNKKKEVQIGCEKIEWKKPIVVFLFTAATCGVLFTIIINFDLGAARDWDVTSVFFLPLIFLSIFLVKEVLLLNKKILFSLLSISIVWGSLWIVLNSSEEKSFQRFLSLESTSLMSPRTRGFYYDELASYFRNKNDFQKVVDYDLKYAEILPLHARICASLSDAYEHLGQKEKQLRALWKVALADSENADHWVNIGQCYFALEKIDSAKIMTQRAVQIDSTNATANFNLGLIQLNIERDCDGAASSFTNTILKNPKNLEALKYLTV